VGHHPIENPHERPARFALVVEIDASETGAELYAEVQATIEASNVAQVTV